MWKVDSNYFIILSSRKPQKILKRRDRQPGADFQSSTLSEHNSLVRLVSTQISNGCILASKNSFKVFFNVDFCPDLSKLNFVWDF